MRPRNLNDWAPRIGAFVLFALIATGPASAQLQQRAAMMQGLDKVTARVSTFPLEIDQIGRAHV